MAVKNKKNIGNAIKKRRSKTIVGSLFRGAGTIFNAPGYNWIGNTIDKLILGNQEDKEEQNSLRDQQQNLSDQNSSLTKRIDSTDNSISSINKVQKTLLDILKNISKEVSFIKDRVSVTFFQVKDLSGEIKDVMYDPLGPAGGQFRRATEDGTLTSALPKELENKVIAKVASYALKQNKEQLEPKLDKIEGQLSKLTGSKDPTSFLDPTEDLTAVDPLERLRREMDEGFEKIMKKLDECCGGRDSGFGGLDLTDLAALGLMGRWFLSSGLARLGLAGLAAGIAGLVGYEVGKYLNDKFNISDKILDGIEWLKDKLGFLGFQTEIEKQSESEGAAKGAYMALTNANLRQQGSDLERVDFNLYQDKEGNKYTFEQLSDAEKEQVKKATENLIQLTYNYKRHIKKNPGEYGLNNPTDQEVNEKIIEIFNGRTEEELLELSKAARQPLEQFKRAYDEKRARDQQRLREDIKTEELRNRTRLFNRTQAEEAARGYGLSDGTMRSLDIRKKYENYMTDLADRASRGEKVPTSETELRTGWIEYLDNLTGGAGKKKEEEFIERGRRDRFDDMVDRGLETDQQKMEREELGGSTYDEIVQGFIGKETGGADNPEDVVGGERLENGTRKISDFSPERTAGKKLSEMTIEEVQDYQEKNRMGSSARGAGGGQFMPGTLRDTIKSYNKENPNDEITKDTVFDLETQEKLVRQLTKDNAKRLREEGIEVNPENLYAAHHLGVNGLKKLRKAIKDGKGDKMMSELFPSQAKTNPHFYKIAAEDFVGNQGQQLRKYMGDNTAEPPPRADQTSDEPTETVDTTTNLESVQDLIQEGRKVLDDGGSLYKPTETTDARDLNLQPEVRPPPPPPDSTQQPNNGGDGDNKTAQLNYIDGRRNIILGGNSDNIDRGVGDTRPTDTSFGRTRMRDSDLPWGGSLA